MKQVAAFIALAFASSFAVYQVGHAAQDSLRNAQIAACQRAKKDRTVNGEGWRIAQEARMASYRRTGNTDDLHASRRYNMIAAELEHRARIRCDRVFPKP